MTRSRAIGIVWRDLLFLLVFGFVSMVVYLLPFVNPPDPDEAAEPPGNVIIAIYWPEGDTDIDLWLMGPGEVRPVGYSNKSGKLFNLLRDDLGRPDTERNYENAYSRGIVAGEYIVNLHLYRGPAPVTVDVEISVNSGKPGKASLRNLASTTTTLRRHGHEATALRFKLDDKANLVPGSLNSVDRPLRSANVGISPDYGG